MTTTPTISVDRYLSRRYHARDYTCLHFAREVMLELTGVDIKERLEGLFAPRAERQLRRAHFRSFRRLDAPVSPCLVVMTRPRCPDTHVGVFLRGRVLHLQENGVSFVPLPLASLLYSQIRYYA